jgi:ABC-type polysaccharide/polyol phosphate transport system ATPase subunit
MAKKTPVLSTQDITYVYEIKALRNNKNRLAKLKSVVLGHKKQIVAIQNVSVELNAGEIISLVGNAGSGKSTLLENFSGNLRPTSGQVWALEQPVLLNGSIAFFGQLSGVDNIKLALLAMGKSKEESQALVREIIEMAHIKKIANHPLNSYPSTIRKKIIFEIAFAVKPKILLIDQRLKLRGQQEKLEFQKRIKALAKSGSCVVFVGMPLAQVSKLCNRMIWLDHGQIKDDGTVTRLLPLFKAKRS